MSLWLLMTILCSATAVVISIPLIRRYEASVSHAQGKEIYEDQLKEVDRDLEAGAIDTNEASAARKEIERRLAAVTTQVSTPVSSGWKLFALACAAGLVILGGVNLYAYMGAPEIPSTPQLATAPATNESNQVESMVAKLKTRLAANPKDAEGWRMLGWASFNLQKYDESAEAYRKAVELDAANIDYKSAYAEALVQAAQGTVTPKAQTILTQVLAKDPKNSRARYYDATAREQAGDQAGALDKWIALLADTPADAGWRENVTQRVAALGKATGRDVSAAIAAAPAASSGTDNSQAAMIAGMISKLAARLETSPKDQQGWAMYVRALTVTGDVKGAEAALKKALEIFKDDKTAIDSFTTLAKGLNIKGP
ncbi:MAG: c-type cytochrome biogenesis protein CcmI [Alphaproteobacteria bacterium]|nr:c-type cytochrome biogenesis protein CcmI [Alphaproteobacteria bacterium]